MRCRRRQRLVLAPRAQHGRPSDTAADHLDSVTSRDLHRFPGFDAATEVNQHIPIVQIDTKTVLLSILSKVQSLVDSVCEHMNWK